MADPEGIYNWHRLDDRITTSGQPTEEQLAEINALGVRHIVNLGLHSHEKALPDEAASVSRLGMEYIHIPVDFQNPTEKDFQQFCSVMERLKGVPVHVHCIANARVSAFFYRYRRDVLGMDDARAKAEMEAVWHPKGVWVDFVERRAAYDTMKAALPLGDFSCPITFESVRPPKPVVQQEGGVTYVVQGDYEIAFRTVLQFTSGKELPIRAKLFGEDSQKVVVRDAAGKPAALSGYTQGRSEIMDTDGNLIFQGRYYDTRTYQALTGDDALTPMGIRVCDHWINGFGRGSYAGHAFSLGVHLTREEDEPAFYGEARGRID